MRLSDELRASLESAATRYHTALGTVGLQAQNFLSGRGIDGDTAHAFRLGVVDGTIPEHVGYTNWLSIPYLTRLGGVTYIKFRRLDDGQPKYVGSGGAPRLYNTLALDKGERLGHVALVEGEFKAIVLDGLCDIPAVGIPGADTWASRPEWAEIFRGFSRVLVFPDPDEAGQKLASRILRDLDTARTVGIPGGLKADDAYLQYGAEAIREAAGL